ncbi:MAG TPA: phosphatase PAP2 family protein [Candidatus Deferrimicrobium sp.]|nr:phosphatase PAP2 family protein [Candidatus Deferrimicrobium sp.]
MKRSPILIGVMFATAMPLAPQKSGAAMPVYMLKDSAYVSTTDSQPYRVEHLWSPQYVGIVIRDVGHTLCAPVHWRKKDWLSFSWKTLAVVGTAALFDEHVRDFTQRNRSGTGDKITERFDKFGANYPFLILSGFYVGGIIWRKPTAQMVALDGLAATLIASEIITPSLKKAVGRHRPYRDDSEFAFDPFSEHGSFPSGHATRAFMTASVIAAHYRQQWIKLTAYSIATLVAVARVNHDQHFASDVLAGAFIGVAVGHGVVHFNRRIRSQR